MGGFYTVYPSGKVDLTHWALSMDLCPETGLIVLGCKDRLVKIVDYYSATFQVSSDGFETKDFGIFGSSGLLNNHISSQDYVAHSDSVTCCKVWGQLLLTASHSAIALWDIKV